MTFNRAAKTAPTETLREDRRAGGPAHISVAVLMGAPHDEDKAGLRGRPLTPKMAAGIPRPLAVTAPAADAPKATASDAGSGSQAEEMRQEWDKCLDKLKDILAQAEHGSVEPQPPNRGERRAQTLEAPTRPPRPDPAQSRNNNRACTLDAGLLEMLQREREMPRVPLRQPERPARPRSASRQGRPGPPQGGRPRSASLRGRPVRMSSQERSDDTSLDKEPLTCVRPPSAGPRPPSASRPLQLPPRAPGMRGGPGRPATPGSASERPSSRGSSCYAEVSECGAMESPRERKQVNLQPPFALAGPRTHLAGTTSQAASMPCHVQARLAEEFCAGRAASKLSREQAQGGIMGMHLRTMCG